VNLERTLGPGVIEWIEANLCHGPGDVQGQPLHLDDEFVAFVCRAYAIDDHGRRLVRRAVYSRPKGRAKSEGGAELACAEALGPVRFSHWRPDGRPVGRRVTAPLVRCAATEEGQADNVYGAVVFMLTEGRIAGMTGLDVGLTRTYLPGGGKIAPITAQASSKEGGKETFVVADETHLWSRHELRQLFETLRRNLVKRKAAEPWSLELTTMYAPGEGSVAEFSHRYAERVAAGSLVDPGFLFDHRQGPMVAADASDAELLQALAQAYGEAASWMDLERLVAEARDPQVDWGDWRRYFLNQPAERTSGRWITDEAWAACLGSSEIPALAEVVPAVDAAHTRDTTAVVWTWRSPDGRLVQRSRVWSCVESKPHDVFVPGGRLDNDLARDFIRDELAERYTVRLVLGDERYFQDQLHELSESGMTAVELAQGSSQMGAAWDEFYGHVHSGSTPRLEHDGDAVYLAHVRNAVGVKTERGWKVSKKNSETSPIDAVAAGAMSAWGAVHAAELEPEPAFTWGPAV
jgi:phage terminase large subunit-like protein